MTARNLVLPLLYFFFSIMSLVILWSLTPELVSKQLLAFALGGGLIWITSQLSQSSLFSHPKLWYGLAIIGLILPLLLPTTKSTQRWIDLPFVSIQPSQFAFVLVSLALIAWITKYWFARFRHLLSYVMAIVLPAILILIEPNLGTALLFGMVMLTLLFLAGIPLRYLLVSGIIVVILAFSGWHWWLKDYQRSRLTSFLNSNQSTAAGYNAQQALIAIGSGGVIGQGFGQGYQSQLQFLPEKHTDFVFASLAEEFGLIGSLLVLCGYVALLSFLLWSSQKANQQGRLFLLTAVAVIFFQLTLHLGANLKLLPITGVPLPLLSYGGSSIVSFALLLGVCQAIIKQPIVKPPLYVG